jgi:hypothetical protein
MFVNDQHETIMTIEVNITVFELMDNTHIQSGKTKTFKTTI